MRGMTHHLSLCEQRAVSSMRSTILTPKGQLGSAAAASDAIRCVLVQGEVMLADARGHLVLCKREVRELVHRAYVDTHHAGLAVPQYVHWPK